MTSDNPLLQDWDTPYGLPPFTLIRSEHFEPALQAAMQLHRDELTALTGQSAAPDFDVTERLPCLATGTPQDAATKATAVEML